ncbi:MFS sugar transporter, putative [Talaromyces stipitatus ATCC 10500]|uniref:MFS sugar transporter, putative n=1 Tax=Talaromyces stipitatus (strain ATCC 10500 / CBS 375.48 / QM 6759 / NRRL 1006) TaxID=441959 RepID=B8MT72_TALSN|nr:MFS sugar transporter, putative [Talaromyces stipitatus ATCC 10500]EED12169.1 MFS sugar transporter, putative [Talaromyces stipitatus ATCC 10500]
MAPFMGLRGSRLNVATILLVVLPAYMCFGYNLAVAGGLLTMPSFIEQFPKMDTVHNSSKFNSNVQGTVVALFTVGGMLGALSTIFVGDILGRRRVIFIASALVIVGSLLMSSSYSFGQFIVARLVQGFGTGATTATVPVWQSEISGTSHRGSHVVTEGLFVSVGIAASLWIDLGFSFIDTSSVSWRVPLVLQTSLAIFVMIFIFRLPESPRWLLGKGRAEEARQILTILRDVDPDDEGVRNEIADVQKSLELVYNVSRWDIVKMGEKRNVHRLALGMTSQSFGQLCGINSLTFYATVIYDQRLHMGGTESRVLSGAMVTIQIIGALAAVFTIDRFGRRPLMLTSATGMCISMAVLAGTSSTSDNHAALIVAVVALYAFNLFYPFGFLGVPFLYSTEVAPPHLRAKISGISNCMTWLFNFVVVEVTPTGFETIGYRYYIVWAVINFAIVATVYFFFPETNARSLEEMDEIFMESRNIFDAPRIAQRLPRKLHLEDDFDEGKY